MTKQGSIIRWDATRAFGFIRSADCAGDVFFHLRDYRGSTPPREGLTVVFEEIHVGGKGPRAMAVRTASSPHGAAQDARSTDSRRAHRPAQARRAAPASRSPRQGKAPSPTTGASLAYGLMAAWAVLLAWGVWMQRLPLWSLAALAALNIVTLWMYASDKNAARAGASGASQKSNCTCCLCSAAGPLPGWPSRTCDTSPARRNFARCTGSRSCCTAARWRGWCLRKPGLLCCFKRLPAALAVDQALVADRAGRRLQVLNPKRWRIAPISASSPMSFRACISAVASSPTT